MQLEKCTDIKIYPQYAIAVSSGNTDVVNSEHPIWPEVASIYESVLSDNQPQKGTLVDDVSIEWLDENWRCHIFNCDKGWAMALRRSPNVIPSLSDDLGFEKSLLTSLTESTGLILFAGSTGAGKSTTMASLLQELSKAKTLGDTVTIEQPIEYRFSDPLVCQREVGIHVDSFKDGIHESMRQFPKNIVIGEIRHPDTAEAAVQAGLTGHRVFATIHAENIQEVCNRMFALLDNQHDELLPQALRGVVCQHLVHGISGATHCLYETLEVTKQVKSILIQGSESLQRLSQEMYAQGRKTLKQSAQAHMAQGFLQQEELTRWL